MPKSEWDLILDDTLELIRQVSKHTSDPKLLRRLEYKMARVRHAIQHGSLAHLKNVRDEVDKILQQITMDKLKRNL